MDYLSTRLLRFAKKVMPIIDPLLWDQFQDHCLKGTSNSPMLFLLPSEGKQTMKLGLTKMRIEDKDWTSTCETGLELHWTDGQKR